VSLVRYVLGFYIPEDGIIHSHCRENIKCYTANRDVSCSIYFSTLKMEATFSSEALVGFQRTNRSSIPADISRL
jgi:hypothetical protein